MTTLVEEWLTMQETLRETYPLLGEISPPPTEEALKRISECGVSVDKSSCFQEGSCLEPGNPMCGNKERG